MFNLEDLKKYRDNVLSALNNNPIIFSRNIYSAPGGRTTSPYLSLNDSRLCCILNNSCKNKPNPSGPIYDDIKVIPGYEYSSNPKKLNYFNLKDGSNNFILETSIIEYLAVKYSSPKILTEQCNLCQYCYFTNLDQLKFIGCDEFTNETLVAFILDYFLGNIGLPTYLKYYTTTICDFEVLGILEKNFDHYGIRLIENIDMGSLSKCGMSDKFNEYRNIKNILSERFTDEQVRGFPNVLEDQTYINYDTYVMNTSFINNVVKQVIITLNYIQKNLQFIHGNLLAQNILVKNEPVNLNYEGINITSPFTCKISNYTYSSLTLKLSNGLNRIYNRVWLFDNYLTDSTFVPIFRNDPEPYYMIDDNFTIRSYIRLRHSGIPFYPTFDTYTFMISFISIPQVYYTIFTDDKLKRTIWQPLWFEDDQNKIYLRITESVQKNKDNSYEEIMRMLFNIKLKCNVTSVVLEKLKYANLNEIV